MFSIGPDAVDGGHQSTVATSVVEMKMHNTYAGSHGGTLSF